MRASAHDTRTWAALHRDLYAVVRRSPRAATAMVATMPWPSEHGDTDYLALCVRELVDRVDVRIVDGPCGTVKSRGGGMRIVEISVGYRRGGEGSEAATWEMTVASDTWPLVSWDRARPYSHYRNWVPLAEFVGAMRRWDGGAPAAVAPKVSLIV